MKKKDQIINYAIIWTLLSALILFKFWHLKYLIWNIGLAFIPYLLSLLISEKKANKFVKLIAAPLWLFFYPNAIYLYTDAIHLSNSQFYTVYPNVEYVMDIYLWASFSIMMFAIVFGIVLSYVSFNNIVSALKLKTVGKYSALTVLSLLTGVAIYIGRFLRFNSWDVLTNLNGLIDFVKSGFTKEAIYFIILFSAFHFFVITIIDFINVKGR